ncbi:MAG: queuosine precursor transporter [Brevefilum sp.]|nr:queuosine precursor transporter [Brevefilum sp.]
MELNVETNTNDSVRNNFKYLDILTVIFVLVLVLSNIASSAKIIDWGVSLGKLALSFDAGTVLFPISYIIGDVLTEVYGYKRSRRIIWLGFGTLAFSAMVFWLVQVLPGEATWQASVGQQTYDQILGSMSSGAIVVASLAGFLAGSFSNAIMMAFMKVLTKGKLLWTRTIGSSIIGQAFDTFAFIFIASALGVFPWSLFWSLTITNYIFKLIVEVVVTPITYWVVNSLKRREGVDIFDEDTNLSPFKF